MVCSGRMRDAKSSNCSGHYDIPLIAVDAAARFLSGSKASPIRKPSGRPSGAVHRCVRRGSTETWPGRFSGAGHALSRRDRERVVHGRPSVTIKSHHNVGGLPERMRFKLIEPLRELFKDEVRKLGRELGLPSASSIAIRFRARARHSHSGRHHRREARAPAQGRRDLYRGDRKAGLTMRSGRPSPCCCRCAPSA